MSILPYALAAIQRGWWILPIEANGKRPALVKSWGEEATDSPARAIEWFASRPDMNYAVATKPSGLVVIDVDVPKPGFEWPSQWAMEGVNSGDDVLACIAMSLGCLEYIDTFTVATPSGGTHYVYRCPEGAQIANSASRLGPLVDVRGNSGHGGYVVGAGSSIDGRRYRVVNGAEVLELPSRLHEAAAAQPRGTAPARGASGDGSSSVAAGDGARFAGALRWLATAAPGTQSAGVYWVACVAKAEGVSAQDCYDAMWPVVAALPCSREPWEEHHLISHIKSAYSGERT